MLLKSLDSNNLPINLSFFKKNIRNNNQISRRKFQLKDVGQKIKSNKKSFRNATNNFEKTKKLKKLAERHMKKKRI